MKIESMHLGNKLKELKEKNLYRKFRTISGSCGNVVRVGIKEFIMLASNNYFGLNGHPEVIQAAKEALQNYGSGNTASRLIVNLELQEELEMELASYKKCDSAIVYSSGYSANVGAISGLFGKNDVIFSDELNHASIIDGCRLSRAEIIVYKHCDVEDLRSKMSALLKSWQGIRERSILVVTDSMFSMDGDAAPLKEIIGLKMRHHFTLMADDAHSTGVLDTNFEGIDIRMGTLSKALASQGGFIAGSGELVDYLRNTSRSFMFSTGLSPPNAASALAALKILKKQKSLKNRLLENADYLRKGLLGLGFRACGQFQIIPLFIDDAEKAVRFQRELEKEGIFASAIRPPTVPTARLRISVMATHTREQLGKALEGFERAGKRIELI